MCLYYINVLYFLVKNLHQHLIAVPIASSSPNVPPISIMDLPTWLINSRPRNPYLSDTRQYNSGYYTCSQRLHTPQGSKRTKQCSGTQPHRAPHQCTGFHSIKTAWPRWTISRHDKRITLRMKSAHVVPRY